MRRREREQEESECERGIRYNTVDMLEMETKLYKLAKLCQVQNSSYALKRELKETLRWESPSGKDLWQTELRSCMTRRELGLKYVANERVSWLKPQG